MKFGLCKFDTLPLSVVKLKSWLALTTLTVRVETLTRPNLHRLVGPRVPPASTTKGYVASYCSSFTSGWICFALAVWLLMPLRVAPQHQRPYEAKETLSRCRLQRWLLLLGWSPRAIARQRSGRAIGHECHGCDKRELPLHVALGD